MTDPIDRPREEYAELIERISLPDSPVGIDAKLTHAVIIAYLQEIHSRLDRIEQRLEAIESSSGR